MDERRRAAAVIVRDGRVLMVHERSRRSGGGEWWTLPGGGLRPGETAEEALRREVFEETGLVVGDARYVLEMPYPSGMTSVFAVTVADGEPRVGRDDGFGPEQLGVDWLPVPELPIETNGVPVPPLMVVLPTLDGQIDGAESASGSLESTAETGAGRGGDDVTARRRSMTK
ncbi:NUDIX domain-containing protein [Actinoplanes sp. CA-252034]|uniref:NUDIX domain-containing protein n=1 Tax=Actinoplanes sp. CA-252034 TaxID=3239906 RepID=UPI003D96BCC1